MSGSWHQSAIDVITAALRSAFAMLTPTDGHQLFIKYSFEQPRWISNSLSAFAMASLWLPAGMSVCLSLGSRWTDFREIWYLNTFYQICRYNRSMITAPQEQRYLQEDLSTFMVTSRYILLRMRIFGTKLVDKNQNTHVLCSVTFFEIAVCEVMWKKIL